MSPVLVKGAVVVALWASDGERIREGSSLMPQTALVRVEEVPCSVRKSTIVVWRVQNKKKLYRVECNTDRVYLEWDTDRSVSPRLVRR